jgi:hypothetical protein
VETPRALVAAESCVEMVTDLALLIPGILGSSLEDFYPLSPEVSWSAEAVIKSKLMHPTSMP